MKKQQSAGRSEQIISLVLQTGVIVSAAIIVLGITMFFVEHNHQNASINGSYHQFISPSYSFPHSISSLISSLRAGKASAVIVLGVLLLILTPVIRVATSILLFLRQRDIPMTCVTLCVLLVLISSFVVGLVIR